MKAAVSIPSFGSVELVEPVRASEEAANESEVRQPSLEELNDQFNNMNFGNGNGSWCLHYSRPSSPVQSDFRVHSTNSLKSILPTESGHSSAAVAAMLHYSPSQSTNSSIMNSPPPTMLRASGIVNNSLSSSSSSDNSDAILLKRFASTKAAKASLPNKEASKSPPAVKLPKVKKRTSLGRPRSSLTKSKSKSKSKVAASVDKEPVKRRKKKVEEQESSEEEPVKKRRSRKKKEIDTSWHDTLVAEIKEDKELYARILRYEVMSLCFYVTQKY